MEGEFLLDSLLEGGALLHGERIRLGNDGDDVDDIGQLLQDHNIDGLKSTHGQLAMDGGGEAEEAIGNYTRDPMAE